ncbi:MAG: zf-HC2 domain-containing protein [Deltaproteobacteria bacterium]
MDCRDCQQRISMLVDGELSEVSTQEVTRHIAACPDCRRVYERMSHVNDVMRSFADLAPSSALAERVKARIADERKRGDETAFLPVWGRVSLAAMLILLAVGVGNLAGRSMNEMLTADHSEHVLELIAPSQGQSFSDALITLGTEENTR